MKVYLHSTVRLSDTFISVQGHFYFLYKFTSQQGFFFHVFPYRIIFMIVMFSRQRERKRTSARLRIG
jgi:hypothetical protein